MQGKKKNNIRIQDIAKILGVSPSTVSRSLNNNPRISEKTKERVWQVAKDLNYELGSPGYYLPQSKHKNIGVIVPFIFGNIFTDLIQLLQEQLTEYNILFTLTENKIEKEQEAIKNYMDLGVEGILISLSGETTNRSYIVKAQEKGLPIVNFGKVDFDLPVRRVIINNYQGAYNATEHLLSKNCKKIAFLLGKENCPITSEIVKGNKSATLKSGLAYKKEHILYPGLIKEEIDIAIKHLFSLKKRPDAIITVTGRMALQVIFSAIKNGISIPQELCVLSFGNESSNEFISPSLTTMEFSAKQLSILIARAFRQTLQDKKEGFNPTSETFILPVYLTVRDSTMRGQKT